MIKFRKRVLSRIVVSAAAAVLGAAVCGILLVLLSNGFEAPSGQSVYYLKGFVCGIGGAVVAVAVAALARDILALRNEDRLKERFIKETDERENAIRLNTEGAASVIVRYGLGLGCVVSVVFNMTVFYTLFAALMAISLINTACRLYYTKRL